MAESISGSTEEAGRLQYWPESLFTSIWTVSTLYVNVQYCLPANVYLNTCETEGLCATECASRGGMCIQVGTCVSV